MVTAMQFSLNNNWIELAPDTRAAVDGMGPFAQHALFLMCCQQAMQVAGGNPPDAENPLATKGFSLERNLIDAQDISDLRAMIDTYADGPARGFIPTSQDPGFNIAWRDEDKGRAAEILHKAFSGAVESVIKGFLGSDFLIRSVTGGRLFPSESQTVSYLWHRDGEVAHQIHVILYLTDVAKGRGSTELIPLKDTMAVAQAGYDFPSVEDRKSDLGAEFAEAGLSYQPFHVEAKAGDALVFTPTRVLHRGVQPRDGARDSLIAIALPSPVSWEMILARNVQGMFREAHLPSITSDPFAGYNPRWQVDRMPWWVKEFKLAPPDWGAGAAL
jgi:hypothetical protein